MTPPTGADPVALALTDPLPRGVVAIEASAGTGKTYTLSALATRAIAEGTIEVSQLLMVSFTEAATAELRGRVRARLVEARDQVTAALAADGGDPLQHAADDLVVMLTDAPPSEVERRRQRLARAVSEFDTATISTIHGLCRRVLGAAADGDRIEVRADHDDLHEVIADVLLAQAAHWSARAADPTDGAAQAEAMARLEVLTSLSTNRLATLATFVLGTPDAVPFDVTPLPEPITGRQAAEQRDRLRATRSLDVLDEIVAEVRRRRIAARRRTLDDLITDTRALLRSPGGAAIAAAWRERYRLVMLDEFQDTDRVQWDIFRELFADAASNSGAGTGVGGSTVVIVGDPKQSIYRFRSADLSAYLDAVASAATVRSLATNWRSDPVVLAGVERLLGDCSFGSADVRFHPVAAPDGRPARRLLGDDGAGVELRVVESGGDRVDSATAQRVIRRDVVAMVRELLDGKRHVLDDATGTSAALRPRDIAVLTGSNADAAAMVAALGAAGLPAASASSNSVFASPACGQWRLLISALERPSSAGAVRAAAMGWFIGMSAEELDALDETAQADLHDLIRSWADRLTTQGVAALVTEVRRAGLRERLLRRIGGERDLTDVEHIAELLQIAAGGGPLTPVQLGQLLTSEVGADDDVAAGEVVARRIDRDDDAVQVMTVHKSKGLEFGVVLCPFLWKSSKDVGVRHAAQARVRTYDPTWLSMTGSLGFITPFRTAAAEEHAAERLRMLYVALTRARHRVITWWANTSGSSALGDVLAQASGGAAPASVADLQPLVTHGADGEPVLTVTAVDPAATAPVGVGRTGTARDGGDAPPPWAIAVFDRQLDRVWRRWSFSSIIADARERSAVDHPQQPMPGGAAPSPTALADAPLAGGFDEPVAATHERDETPVETPPDRSDVWGDLPRGREFGTLVHRVLEQVDFAVDDRIAVLRAAIDRDPVSAAWATELAVGLDRTLGAPLGGIEGARRLADLRRTDRLDELDFHLPLGACTAADIGRVLARTLPADDPFAAWAATLAADGVDVRIEGMLTGSIDLVARSADGTRVWIADYKTNALGGPDAYDRAAMAQAMIDHHYPLQATLYLVAVHRMLGLRRRDYDPGRHLAGAAYLFVRGMRPGPVGDASPGVFWWSPPPSAIIAVDHLFGGGQ